MCRIRTLEIIALLLSLILVACESQFTYGHDTEDWSWHREDMEALELGRVERDGVDVAVMWGEDTERYTANTGSGLRSLLAVQFCDCHVPTGQHVYEVFFSPPEGDWEEWRWDERSWRLSINVVEDLGDPDPPDICPPSWDGGVDPWDIPEPTRVQGLHCARVCSETPGAGEREQDVGAESPVSREDAGRNPDAGGDAEPPAPPEDAGERPTAPIFEVGTGGASDVGGSTVPSQPTRGDLPVRPRRSRRSTP